MADAQPQPEKPQQQEKQQQPLSGYLAEIVDINMKVKTGISGEIYSISCKILEGNDKGRIIRRNILGPVKIGDVVRLPDTSREAREIRVK
jgi:small subunit ribosomal protein S28e